MSDMATNSVLEEVSPCSKKRKVILEQSREIIFNVYNYFKKQGVTGQLLDTVAEATGISRSTVGRIIKEGHAVETGKENSFLSTKIKPPKPSPKSTVDNCGEEIIRRIILNFHVTEKRRPTIKAVYNKIHDDEGIGFTRRLSSFRKLLLRIGFRWKKTTDNRKILMEWFDIRELRSSYIRKITNYRTQGRPITYTDETYIHAGHTTPFGWVDQSNEGLKSPISKGKRLIIVHAGSAEGFVNDALLIFKSGQKSGDYHDDMNFINYKKWLETSLIPNLPDNSVVVVDNASYHNVMSYKHPTSASRKCDMIQWLNERGITYDANSTKPELYNLVKLHKPKHIQYSIDGIFAKKGHTVLRLPPYHPELNPIEKIWGIVKNRVASRNVTFHINDVEKLAREEFSNIKVEEWSETCRHVEGVEKDYIMKEHIMDDFCEEFIINVNNDSEDDFYDFSSDED